MCANSFFRSQLRILAGIVRRDTGVSPVPAVLWCAKTWWRDLLSFWRFTHGRDAHVTNEPTIQSAGVPELRRVGVLTHRRRFRRGGAVGEYTHPTLADLHLPAQRRYASESLE